MDFKKIQRNQIHPVFIPYIDINETIGIPI